MCCFSAILVLVFETSTLELPLSKKKLFFCFFGFWIPDSLLLLFLCRSCVDSEFRIPSRNRSEFIHWLKPDSKFRIPKFRLEIEINFYTGCRRIPDSEFLHIRNKFLYRIMPDSKFRIPMHSK